MSGTVRVTTDERGHCYPLSSSDSGISPTTPVGSVICVGEEKSLAVIAGASRGLPDTSARTAPINVFLCGGISSAWEHRVSPSEGSDVTHLPTRDRSDEREGAVARRLEPVCGATPDRHRVFPPQRPQPPAECPPSVQQCDAETRRRPPANGY